MPEETTKKFGTIVTDVGTMRTREAVLEGKKINLTTLAVGDGGGAYYVPSADMQGLKNDSVKGIKRHKKRVPGNVIEKSIFHTGNAAFKARGKIQGLRRVLVEVTMHIEFSNTGIITFIVDPYALTATKKDIQEKSPSSTRAMRLSRPAARFRACAASSAAFAAVSTAALHAVATKPGFRFGGTRAEVARIRERRCLK